MNNKCWVFCQGLFDRYMKQNKWNDNNIPENSAFISIADPDWKELEMPEITSHWFSDNIPHVMNLEFHDINGETVEGRTDLIGFNTEMAEKLFSFIEEHIGCDFYIHCSAGASRSQGVARFIFDMYSDMYPENKCHNTQNPCNTWNVHVACMLKKQFYKKYMGYN